MQIPLSPLDYAFLNDDPILMLLRYDQRLDPTTVENAFHAVIPHFSGANGRLVQTDEATLAFAFDPEAKANFEVIHVDDEAGTDLVSISHFAPSTDQADSTLAQGYLLQRRHSSSICLQVAHCLADGYGFFLLLMAWAARCRGAELTPPSTDRSAMGAKLAGLPKRQTDPQPCAPPPNVLQHSHLTINPSNTPPARIPYEARLQHVRRAPLEEQAQALDCTLNALQTAMTWQRHAQTLADGAPCSLVFYADIRRHHPGLDAHYFGNASLPVRLQALAEQVRSASLAELAARISDGVARVKTRVPSAVAELEHLRRTEGLAVATRLSSVPSDGVVNTDVSRLPLASVDFGAGPPQRFDMVRGAYSICPARVVLPSAIPSELLFVQTTGLSG